MPRLCYKVVWKKQKLKKLNQSQVDLNPLISSSTATVPTIPEADESFSKSEQGCKKDAPTAPSNDEKACEINRNDQNVVTSEKNRTDDINQAECAKCEELKTSLLILQDSIIELKEEMLHQKATTDLVLSTPDTSDKKISSLLKGKISPLENAIAEMRNNLNLLRASVEDQRKMLDTLIDSQKQADGNLNKSTQKLHKATITRIESPVIGQKTLKQAINKVKKPTVAHPPAQTPSTNTANLVPKAPQAQPKAIKKDSGQTGNSSQKAKSWAEKVATGDGKPFTKVSSNNASNHRENATVAPPETPTNNLIPYNQAEPSEPMEKRSPKPPPTHNPSQLGNHKQGLTTSGEKYSRGSNGEFQYRCYTTLLIHDGHFDDFSPHLFNSQFNVHKLQANSYESLSNKKAQLNNILKRLRPDCIYVHTGINDVLKKKAGVISYIEELSDHLLKSTEAQICFSLMIPSTNDSNLNEKIGMLNTEIVDYISWLHQNDSVTRKRIFSFTNDPLADYNFYSTTTGFKLRERGQKLLWLRLREGLRKTMRLPRINYQSRNTSQRITNRFSDD